ncbi:hypothetical protein [Amycolatopsis sp. NPDC001319]|uniref:hypothetical protein n=1 Tax=unclassified Amycolatopsis TaxID=2618356 RepID=UPI00369A6ECE
MTAEATEFLTAGLRPHECRSCGTFVLVKKNSLAHTSIQWTTDASRSCPVFAAHVAAGRHPALLDTCEKLADSIAGAMADGILAVADESRNGVVRGG